MKELIHSLKGDKVIWAFVALLALFSFMPVFSASSNLAYMRHGSGNALTYLLKHGAQEHQQRSQRGVGALQIGLVAEDQHHAAVADGHGHALAQRDAPTVHEPAQHQHQRGIEVQDQPLQAGADVLQAPEIEKTREVVAGEPQADDAEPVLAGERGLAPAGPPGQRQEQRQREQHAVHDERDRVDPVAVRQLDDDGLAAEGDGAGGGEQEAGGEVGMGSGGGHEARDYRWPHSQLLAAGE